MVDFVETFAKEFTASLTRTIYELDIKVVAAQSSQVELIKEMDRLATELHSILAASNPPPIDATLQRLLVCRKKLLAVNVILKVCQERLVRVSGLLKK
ncbi:hypothetical protein HDU99_008801 [Rhizoclosmatium hyalinum]|nr:hypothetical protein HDU99_008801 [Rhizoclosmatium hyalinum]